MSHSKERHEKICLNCNANVIGRYCHVCGQENIEPKETVWSLISHFFYDITHFDGKFFSTSRYLITRPGFLPKEYIEGRRARYLHPIRMYVFSSAVFFIFLYSMFHFESTFKGENTISKKVEEVKMKIDSARLTALAEAKDKDDSATIDRAFGIAVDPYVKKLAAEEEAELKDDTAGTSDKFKEKYLKKLEKRKNREKEKKVDNDNFNINLVGADRRYTSLQQYDSVQKALPEYERDGWVERHAKHREIELNERYDGDQKAMWKDLLTKFTHTFPYLLFVSLPLYALYLSLLYRRQRRQFPYVTHGIFLIYLYIFTFINLLVYFGINQIKESTDWNWIGWLEAAVLLYGVYYAYKAMRKFYGQGRGKTFLKFCILNFLAFCSISILFAAFFLFAVFKF